MTRRPGLSLTEVLVALFIMGIGAIAILTLFPLGALNMAQAFRDDRTTQCAAQSGAYLRDYWQQRFTSQTITPGTPDLDAELFFRALNNPQVMATDPFGGTAGEGRAMFPVADTTDSYPVLVDPMGYLSPRPTVTSKRWLGDDGYGNAGSATAVPRASLSQILPPAVVAGRINTLALRTCSLLDGLGYDPNTGAPALVGGVIDRDVRYNWLWVVQRLSGQTKYEASVTVVVFDKRGHLFAPPGSETVHTPTYAQPEVTQDVARGKTLAIRGESRISFAKGTEPLVQKGGWLMDATVTTVLETGVNSNRYTVFVPPTAPPAPPPGQPQPQAGVRNAHFYRVIGITDDGVNVDIELETALRPDTGLDYDAGSPTGALRPQFRRFVALVGVAEVFNLTVPLKAN